MKSSFRFMLGCVMGWGAIAQADDVGLALALRLQAEGDAHGSAIEFRRLGMQASAPDQQAGFFWAAGYQYWQKGTYRIADQMLDQTDDRTMALEGETMLLRGELAESRNDYRSATFYWRALLRADDDAEREQWARRRLASDHLRQREYDEARALLRDSPLDEERALAALERFEQGRDKNPRLGGLLGVLPGMGYAYAGEYANAFRSLILNSLFIFGMVDTARNDHWGGFAVITFFEITWFTGSIYGGIDASHRYNQRRLQTALDEIDGNARFEPDWQQLPAISLRFDF